jgi:hypothetical protein
VKSAKNNHFSGQLTVFHGRRLPEIATLAGYSALIDAFELNTPLPRTLAATSDHHQTRRENSWQILTARHAPEPTLESHLTFALKYEGLDLAVLSKLFKKIGPAPVAEIVRSTPTGKYARQIWFLYEWLTNSLLDIPDASSGTYVPVVNTGKQYAISGTNVTRQRVKNNLPGHREFCPMVFRTRTLDELESLNLAATARSAIAKVPKDILSRAAAFLLLKDSKSSYAIENEKPPQDRIQRWGRAIGEAGRHPMDLDELLRLQEMVIGDTRFIHIGLRIEGGFVGEHDRATGMPIPAHISARPEDLASLVNGMFEFDQGVAEKIDPVVAAAILAFGFVYAHPFEDGNGRIHRYLIHHILSRRGFNPPGMIFPVSAVILDRIDEYRSVLEDYSTRLLPCIEWTATSSGNVDVRNDTADFYRYFDATPHAEFLYSCVKRTIEVDLPKETRFLENYEKFCSGLDTMFEMPNRIKDQLFRFLHQNGGRLSKRALSKEFVKLSKGEVDEVEELYLRWFR